MTSLLPFHVSFDKPNLVKKKLPECTVSNLLIKIHTPSNMFRQNLVSLGPFRCIDMVFLSFSSYRCYSLTEVSCTVEPRYSVVVTRVREASEHKLPIVAHVISIYRHPQYATPNRGEQTLAIVKCALLGHYAASGGNSLTTTLCVITQKKSVLSYFAAEA